MYVCVFHPIDVYPKDGYEEKRGSVSAATHKDRCLCAVFRSEPEVLKQVLKDKGEYSRQKNEKCKTTDK